MKAFNHIYDLPQFEDINIEAFVEDIMQSELVKNLAPGVEELADQYNSTLPGFQMFILLTASCRPKDLIVL